MEVVPYQQTNNWRSLAKNGILFITLGIIIVIGVLLFALPIFSVRALFSVGKKFLSSARTTVTLGIDVSKKAIGTSLYLVRKTGKITKDGLMTVSEGAVDILRFATSCVKDIYGMFGKTVRFGVSALKDVVNAIFTASKFVMEKLSSVARMAVETFMKGFERVMETVSNVKEFLCDAVENLFAPAAETALKTVEKKATMARKVFTRYLPLIIKKMKMIIVTVFKKIAKNPKKTAKVVGVFVAFALLTKLTKKLKLDVDNNTDNIVLNIARTATALADALFTFAESDGLCNGIVDLVMIGNKVSGRQAFLNIIPGVDLTACDRQFIALGLKWKTAGIICANKNTAAESSNCLAGFLNNIIVVPALNFGDNAREFIDDNVPSPFNIMLNSLVFVSVDIQAMSFGFILENLAKVIELLLIEIETYLTFVARTSRKAAFKLVESVASADFVSYTTIIFQFYWRLIKRLVVRIIELLKQGAAFIIKTLVCTPLSYICIPVGIDFSCCCLPIICKPKICPCGIEWRCLDEFVNCEKVVDVALDKIQEVIVGGTGSLLEWVAKKILGVNSIDAEGDW